MALTINPKVTDLSHHNDVTDGFAGAVRMGLRGVINKVTEGRGFHDKSFNWRRGPAAKAGLLYGAYHFIRPGNPIDQAKSFLDSIGSPDGLLLALDHEDRAVSLANARAFQEYVHDKVGRYPILYSGFLIKEQLGSLGPNTSTGRFWSQIKLWLCHYSTRPRWPRVWDEPWLWQYTGDGLGPKPHTVPGIKPLGQLDINSYQHSDDQLAQEWAQ